MAFVKRDEKRSISVDLLGSRDDTASIRLYQESTTTLADTEAASVADDIKTAIEAISDCKVVGFNYMSGVWDDDAYFPATTGDMQDTGVFVFATEKRKRVSITIPAFKRSLLVPTRVAAGGATAPTATAVSLANQDQLINAGDTDVETFVQFIIAGVTVGANTFAPHAKREEDGDIVAMVSAKFFQKASPTRTSAQG